MSVVSGTTPAATSPAPVAREVVRERGVLLLGALPGLLRNAPAFLSRLSLAHPGELIALRIGPRWVYLVSQPEHLQHVLVDNVRNFPKGSMWNATKDLFGEGMLRSEGPLWLRQRRMMQPLFGTKHLSLLADAMVDVVDREVRSMERLAAPGVRCEMGSLMTSLTQRILLEAMFGTAIPREDADRLGQHIVDALRVINLKVFLFFLPGKFPLPGRARLRHAVGEIDRAMLGLVGQRRQSGESRNDLLSLLLDARDDESNETMDDRQVRDELVNLYTAGTDTTANALTFFWYLLATHPEIESRVRAEVREVIGTRLPVHADLAKLTYTRMAFQEAMRLYPPVWMFPRFCSQDDVVGGYPIPGGSALLILPWLTHRDPRFWERPEEFDPERFLPQRSAERPKYAYFPFGGGGRQCIGMAFAMMEASFIIARMLQTFRFRLPPGYRMVPASMATLKPRGGLPMLVERVDC